MAEIMKHVGVYGGKPCVVVFREVPNEPENCLIVLSGGLEEVKHDDLMNVVSSAEGQGAREISEVLARRQFTTGEQILNDLHFTKKLVKVPVSQVNLTPTPSQEVPLSEVNAEIRKIDANIKDIRDPAVANDVANAEQPIMESSADVAQAEAPVAAVEDQDPTDIAKGLLAQADLMEEDGNRMLQDADLKREEAYALDPKLRGPGRPKKIAK
jgi:hypothetical protein